MISKNIIVITYYNNKGGTLILMKPFYYGDEKQNPNFVPVDQWIPEPQDEIFKNCKGALVLPVSQYFQIDNPNLDYFVLSTKRCYNGKKMREHNPLYMNYFEKFYDTDKELLQILFRLKYLIDFQKDYDKKAFIHDIKRYILSDRMINKAIAMNNDNYNLGLDNNCYKNDNNPSLQYNDKHGKILMLMSLLMNMCIPLLTHWVYVKKIEDTNDFLLEVFDIILNITDVDIYNKLYETSISNINKNAKKHAAIWEMQDIRSKNVTTHSLESVNNIILNIMPKYTYDKNVVSFNFTSIRHNTHFQVTGIEFEFSYVALSSSKRDEDNNSEFDKFESYQIKQNEALYLQNKVNAEETMRSIGYQYGPFNQDEIEYYIERLNNDNNSIINAFQKNLIFNLFYKYFGDPTSINAINKIDYVKLMIAAKKQLIANNMVILPYIISSKVIRLQPRKSVNKKELIKLENSKYFQQVKEKYNSEKMEKYILSLIATILSSEFQIIDYYDEDIDGKKIENIPDIICEEILMYVNLI